MDVADLELQYRRPGGSPTDLLLTNWGHSNATVEMLVSHLLRAGLIYAAERLRGLGLWTTNPSLNLPVFSQPY